MIDSFQGRIRAPRRAWIVLAWLAISGASSLARPQEGQESGVEKNLGFVARDRDDGATRRALVVGVQDYERSDLNLTFPEKDAADLTRALRGAGWLVRVMSMKEGVKPWSAKSILNELTALVNEAGANDTLLFYFSGHGYVDEDKQGYLCAFNTDPESASTLRDTALSLDVVRATLSRGKAKRLLLVLDCCRSMPGSRDPNAMGFTEAELMEAEGVGVLFGTAPGFRCWEPSGEETDEKGARIENGRFTHFLLRGLSGEARLYDDGYLTFLELSKWVARQMNEYSSKRPPNQRQAPFTNWEGRADVDVILKPMPKLEAPPPPKPATGVPDPKLFEGLPQFGRDEEGRFLRIRHLQTGIVLRLIPAGRFYMGQVPGELKGLTIPEGYDTSDELPRHEVEITKPFYLGETEVTVGQWRMFAQTGYRIEGERDGKGGWTFVKEGDTWLWKQRVDATWKDPLPDFDFEPGEDHPVTQVSWNDAMAFCGKYGFTLPTEAQWEYACRAGTNTRFWWGDGLEAGVGKLNGATNEAKNPGFTWSNTFPFQDGFTFTAPVGSFAANDFGLKDMAGNVWEWCLDGYDAHAYSKRATDLAKDPYLPASAAPSGFVALRGGSWLNEPVYARAANRNPLAPDSWFDVVGFRVARTF